MRHQVKSGTDKCYGMWFSLEITVLCIVVTLPIKVLGFYFQGAKRIQFTAPEPVTSNLTLLIEELSTRKKKNRPQLAIHLANGLGNQLYMISGLLSVAIDHMPRFSVVLPNVSHLKPSWPEYKKPVPTYWGSVFTKLAPLLGEVDEEPKVPEHCKIWQQHPCIDNHCESDDLYKPGWDSALLHQSDCRVFVLQGQFINRIYYGRHLPVLKQLFIDEASVQRASRFVDELSYGKGGPIVSIHYRLGDFVSAGWDLHDDYYVRAMSRVADQLGSNTTCLIFANQPGPAWLRSTRLLSHQCGSQVLVPLRYNDVESFYMMGLADANVLAYSSFSFWAAALGRDGRIVVTPNVSETGGPKKGPRVTVEPGWISLAAQEG